LDRVPQWAWRVAIEFDYANFGSLWGLAAGRLARHRGACGVLIALRGQILLYLRAPLRYPVPMKLEAHGDTLRVSGLKELDATNSTEVCASIRAALNPAQRHIEIDLAQTGYLDSSGLGTLVALHKTACSREGALRLHNPVPAVQEVLKLTRLGRIFEIRMN
jgi:anti-sigma B factor antagonist